MSAPLAQLVEQFTCNEQVVSSSLTGSSNSFVSEHGTLLFNGRKIDTTNIADQMKTSNYLAKYLTKSHDIGQWQKRFYHTLNLDFKGTETKMIYPHELKKLENAVADGKLKLHKQAETFKIFRVYNHDKP